MAGNHLGRYEIIKTLAKGALTDLLVGRASGMEGFQRYVAIKLLRAEFAKQASTFESFVNEARLAAVLHHHNIVQVHDIGEDHGQPYFAMEYVHGVDLRTLLAKLAKRNEQLPLQHVVSVVASAAAALHHAHEQKGPDGMPLGIVHRDVSPGNVLVGFDGNVKVVDFGIAKAAIKTIQSDAGVLKGQAPYMSPEQCAGKAVDRRSDVFALGIVLYELATVRRLFKGSNEFLTMSAVVNAEVPKPSQYRRDIPSQLESIMLRALARDPSQRFQTAGEMSLALDKVASTVGVGASTTALANYMRLQFGDQREPWLAAPIHDEEDDYSEVTEVDFDGPASGLAPPPSEAALRNAIPRVVGATKSSPIVAARSYAMTPPVAEKSRAALPLPHTKVPPRPQALPPETPLERAKTNVKPLRGEDTTVDAHAPTELGAVIVRPTAMQAHVRPAFLPDASATAIVQPLPVVQYTMPTKRARSARPLWLMLTALLAGGVAVAAVVLWPGAEVAPAAAPQAEAPVANEAPRPPPTPAAQPPTPAAEPPTPAAEPPTPAAAQPAPVQPPAVEPVPAKPAMQMTQADYERERAAAAAAVAEPAVAEPENIAPVAKQVAPAKRTTTKTPVKRTVAKAAAKPAPPKKAAKKAPAKKPKWNPDDLFLEDK